MHFAGHIFNLDAAVVKRQNVELAWRLLYLGKNTSPQRNDQIKSTKCDVTEEKVHDSQII